MPITVIPTGAGILTPMQAVDWSSDFIGPIPVGSHLDVSLQAVGTEFEIWRGTVTTQLTSGRFTLFNRSAPGLDGQQVVSQAIDDGTQAHIVAKLFDPNATIIDQGVSNPLPWRPTAGLPSQLLNQPTSTGGGLTQEQAQQLTDIHLATAVQQLVNAITLEPLTSGPTPGPVNAFLPTTIFGIIVRLASVPDIPPTTPDSNYWVKTLATVRVFRQDDLWLRVPIHTSSKIVNFHSEALLMGLADITLSAWILQLSLQVNFLEGVTGEVFLMRFP